MKIVITGAAGHIGSYIIRDLAEQFRGAEIILIDNHGYKSIGSLSRSLGSKGFGTRFSFRNKKANSAVKKGITATITTIVKYSILI